MSIENTHYGAEAISVRLADCRRFFFIGIGGISMSALARLTAQKGYAAGGSDRTRSAITDALEREGIEIFFGHDAANLRGYDAVIYTVAIGEDNPEYREALRLGLPLYSRADYLGYVMFEFDTRIGISGMHGKSTCTAMCASILTHAGDSTVLCGAEMPFLGNSACHIGTTRSRFLFEACEYMDSFLDFNPTLAVVLNIGLDHVDYFHSMEQIRTSFLHFAERTGEGGCVLYNADDEETATALAPFAGKRLNFGLETSTADFCARAITVEEGRTSFDFFAHGNFVCRISISVFGTHNVYNALAAAAAALIVGASPDDIVQGLAAFTGAHRRMERKGVLPSGAVVFDDYGHHPDEIRATLAGARQMGFGRVLCAYQPHTYSRTAGLLQEFTNAFGDADRVFFADVYAAREQNIYGVTSQTLSDRIGSRALYCGSFAAVADAIRREARAGDLVIVMGAGDIFHVFDLLDLE